MDKVIIVTIIVIIIIIITEWKRILFREWIAFLVVNTWKLKMYLFLINFIIILSFHVFYLYHSIVTTISEVEKIFENEKIRLTTDLQQKESQIHKIQTDLVKTQTHAAQLEDETKSQQDVIKGLQVYILNLFK